MIVTQRQQSRALERNATKRLVDTSLNRARKIRVANARLMQGLIQTRAENERLKEVVKQLRAELVIAEDQSDRWRDTSYKLRDRLEGVIAVYDDDVWENRSRKRRRERSSDPETPAQD